MPEWRVLSEDAGAMVSARSNLVLCRLLGAPTPEVLKQIEHAIDGCDAAAVVVILVGTQVGLPSGQTRREAVGVMKSRENRIEAWVVILEGSSFFRSALRSVANTIRLLARTRFPLSIVDSPDAAARWISEKTTSEITSAEIRWPNDPACTG